MSHSLSLTKKPAYNRAWWGLSFCLLALMAGTSLADGLPTLGEHEFVPATNIREPFIKTYLQSTVTLGKAMNMSVPVFDLSDSTIIGTAQSNLLVAGLGFSYQHAPKEWLAVDIGMFTVGRVGTSTSTLLAEGVTGAFGFNMGWMVRMYESETFLLSGSVGLSTRKATYINLLDWAEGLVAGETGPDNPLVRSVSSLRGSGGLHFGWGLSRRFGMLGALKLALGESMTGLGENKWSSDLRLGMSYNSIHDLNLPIGVSVVGGYLDDDERGFKEGNNVWFWSTRLGYQGRQDFSVGLDLKTSYIKGTGPTTLQVTMLGIDLRYYF